MLRLSARHMGLNTVEASRETFKILAGKCGNLLILRSTKTSFLSKFSCVLSLPPTNVEWLASFLGLSLPSLRTGPLSDFTQESLKENVNQQWQEWVSQCNCKQGFQAKCDLQNSCIMEGLDPSGGAVERWASGYWGME